MKKPTLTNITSEIDHSIKLDNPEPPTGEMVNHPSHYNQGKREVIEEMRLMFGDSAVADFCRLSAYKYMRRADYKGKKEEDLAKAEWYMDYLDKMEEKRVAMYAAPKPEPIHVVLDTVLDAYAKCDTDNIEGQDESDSFFVPANLPDGVRPV